ncbi:hypothetical protein KGR20_15530 [Cytobacillus oceanisediminis]|uniref:Uncharacterized protein n=2 Tax=Niallia TaxID=2837506 RepID=A0A941JN57_NIACI|nr:MULTISPECIES: hypothetical protein [Bacillaceae]EOR22911.1 preprotein translocase subunit SecA [Niallia nealsonii AAU1]MBQ6447436.1 hypothetical protein [Bacillus sp. (in: firmicutes)]MDU1845747.1 hypothetical protein [Niallia nealsonii]MBZ9535644.1 hypothetical protein [Cytobacillus oceanisediminis]MCB5239023.1 hypothetical protein [Niallia circulans]
MVTIHFFENSTNVLTQLRQEIPNIDQQVKIKGRKGKVLSINQVKDHVYQVNIEFEKIVKKAAVAADNKKRRR